MEARPMLAVLGLLFLGGANSQSCTTFTETTSDQHGVSCCNAFSMYLGTCCSPFAGVCLCMKGYMCDLSTTTTSVTPTSLCPSVPAAVFGRLIGAQGVTDPCENKGVVGMYADFSALGAGLSTRVQFCNAVVVYNGVTGSRELVMNTLCQTKGITTLTSIGASFFIESQGKKFALKDCNVESTTTVNSMIKMVLDPILSGYLDSLSASCDNTACAFKSTTMDPELILNGCYLMSFGAVGLNSFNPSEFETDGLRRASVSVVANGFCSSTNEPDVRCLQLDGNAAVCAGDTSAALFCPLSTGEEVFMGMVNTEQNACVGTTPSYVSFRLYDTGP